MIKYKNLLLILLLIFTIKCSPEKEEIKNGIFELYENDSHIGTLYRKDNFQYEKYNDKSELISKLEYNTDSTYFLKGTEINPKGIDTIIFLNTYKKIGKNKWKIIIVPFNSNIDYKYEGVLVKTGNTIDKKYLDTLNYLNDNR